MKADLVRWLFKSSQCPECLPTDFSVHKLLNIVKNRIIGHRSFNNVICMRMSRSTRGNKIQPFLRELLECKNTKGCTWRIQVFIDNAMTVMPNSPASCLFSIKCTLKPEIKIFMILCYSNFRFLHNHIATMIYNNTQVCPSPLLFYIQVYHVRLHFSTSDSPP